MSLPFPAFFLPAPDGSFQATPLCIGPWDERFCHGGPPCALLAAAIEQAPGADDFQVGRISFDLLRPVPVGRLRVELEAERRGRSVERWRARLLAAGRLVVEARGLRIRRAAVAVPSPPRIAPWPAPDTLERFVFPFFHVQLAYHQAVDLRLAQGRWGTTPVGFWGRPLVPLVEGKTTSDLARLVVLADAQSGMGVPAPPATHTFLNPDLHLHFERLPAGEWLGFDIRSAAGSTGMGLSQSALRDAHGAVGRSAQSLLMAAR